MTMWILAERARKKGGENVDLSKAIADIRVVS